MPSPEMGVTVSFFSFGFLFMWHLFSDASTTMNLQPPSTPGTPAVLSLFYFSHSIYRHLAYCIIYNIVYFYIIFFKSNIHELRDVYHYFSWTQTVCLAYYKHLVHHWWLNELNERTNEFLWYLTIPKWSRWWYLFVQSSSMFVKADSC